MVHYHGVDNVLTLFLVLPVHLKPDNLKKDSIKSIISLNFQNFTFCNKLKTESVCIFRVMFSWKLFGVLYHCAHLWHLDICRWRSKPMWQTSQERCELFHKIQNKKFCDLWLIWRISVHLVFSSSLVNGILISSFMQWNCKSVVLNLKVGFLSKGTAIS